MQTRSLPQLLKKKFIGTDELRKDLTKILEELPKSKELVITQHGQPVAALMDLEFLIKIEEKINNLNLKK